MSISDFLKRGQEVTFQVEQPEVSPKLQAVVEEMSADKFIVHVGDERYSPDMIKGNPQAAVLGTRAGLEYSLKVTVEKIENNRIFLTYLPSRSHLRVNSYVIIDYHVISGEAFIEKRKRFIQTISRDTEDFLYAQRGFISEDSETGREHTTADLVNEIKMLHKKVDFIINHLLKSEDDNILDKKQTEVNLSGSGMKFTAKAPLKTGDFLDMKLVLPMSSGIVIELIAEVVWVTPLTDKDSAGSDGACEAGVRFAAINEDDRELIIRYTFKRQRELLRAFESSA